MDLREVFAANFAPSAPRERPIAGWSRLWGWGKSKLSKPTWERRVLRKPEDHGQDRHRPGGWAGRAIKDSKEKQTFSIAGQISLSGCASPDLAAIVCLD